MSVITELAGKDETTFKAKKLVVREALAHGILLQPERVQLQLLQLGIEHVIEAIVTLATQEEEVCDIPADWWQACKERWFPKWLKRRYPVRYDQIWSEHNFPEIELPDFGREFVHFKKIRWGDLERIGAGGGDGEPHQSVKLAPSG